MAERTRTVSPKPPAAKPPRQKPGKPYADFPLFPHATGRWAKKIRGKFAFFGPWEDPHGALERFTKERDALYAGFTPRANGHAARTVAAAGTTSRARRSAASTAVSETATLRDLVNRFLTAKQRRVDSGEMTARSFSDYFQTAERMLKALGKDRRVDDVTAGDFGRLRAALAVGLGPVALSNHIQRVRSIFKFAFDTELLDSPVRFGPEFVKPNKRAMRLARKERGERLFEPEEIKTLMTAAGVQMRAMILLGLNAGLGNTDVSVLPRSAVDMKTGILDFPRPKTGIPRRAVLWPETLRALEAVAKVRPKPKEADDRGLVFVTKYGHPWVRVKAPGERAKGKTRAVTVDAVGLEFGKLLREAGLAKAGIGFYALRHTFRTVADEVNDRPAVDLVMGHQDGQDIATHYVEKISDERLRRVAEHVRGWAGVEKK